MPLPCCHSLASPITYLMPPPLLSIFLSSRPSRNNKLTYITSKQSNLLPPHPQIISYTLISPSHTISPSISFLILLSFQFQDISPEIFTLPEDWKWCRKRVIELYSMQTGPLAQLIPADQIVKLSWPHLHAFSMTHLPANLFYLRMYLPKCLFKCHNCTHLCSFLLFHTCTSLGSFLNLSPPTLNLCPW